MGFETGSSKELDVDYKFHQSVCRCLKAAVQYYITTVLVLVRWGGEGVSVPWLVSLCYCVTSNWGHHAQNLLHRATLAKTRQLRLIRLV